MDRLPAEICQKVLREVELSDLKVMRLVNRQFAALATPLLFTVIQFFGPDHREALAGGRWTYPKRRAEFGKLQEAVAQVLPVASAARKLIFAPAFYREGFWDDYRARLRDRIDAPVEQHELYEYSEFEDESDEEDLDNDDENSRLDARHQAIIDRRRARLDEERELIFEAEKQWELKRQEQEANKKLIEEALEALIQRMRCLDEVEISVWEFDHFGGLYFDSYELDVFRTGFSPTNHLLQFLATCLHKSHRHIRKMRCQSFNPEMIHDSPAMSHVFSALQHLRLDINLLDSLLETSTTNHALPKLFKHAQSTLERLELVSGGKWPQLPTRGAHSLGKILNDEESGAPLCFRRLEVFRLCSWIVTTTSLVDFIAAQPRLSTLEFDYVYLVTPGMGWTALATALPKSVKTWVVSGAVGEEPYAHHTPPISYNWCREWRHQQEPLSEETGWRGEPVDSLRTRFRRVTQRRQND